MILFSEVKQKYPDLYLLHGTSPIDVNQKSFIQKLQNLYAVYNSAYLIRENCKFQNYLVQGFVVEEAEIIDVKKEDGGRNEFNNFNCTNMSDIEMWHVIEEIYKGKFDPYCDLWVKINKVNSIYFHPFYGAELSSYEQIKVDFGIENILSIDFLTGKIKFIL